MAEEWLTTAEAAEFSGYSIQYIQRLMRSGKVEARKFGRTWQVNRASLVSYVLAAEKSVDKRRGPKK